jgi:predicted RNase H-like nuclease
MKPLRLTDFLPKKEEREANQQVKMSREMHEKFRTALKKRGLSAQDVLLAAVQMFIAESENNK